MIANYEIVECIAIMQCFSDKIIYHVLLKASVQVLLATKEKQISVIFLFLFLLKLNRIEF